MKRKFLLLAFFSCFLILSISFIPSAQKSNVIINSTLDEPPTVEILEPENNTVFYSPYFEISVKFTDDIELEEVEVKYGGYHDGITYRSGSHHSGLLYDLFFINLSVRRILPGMTYIEAKAEDMNNNTATEKIFIFYNSSNDLFPPDIEISKPQKGWIFISDDIVRITNLNFAIIIGDFEFSADIWDSEINLHEMNLYLDDELVMTENYDDGYNQLHDFIHWKWERPLFGFHEIKLEAIDVYDNVAIETIKFFVIDFNLK
ncbi:hypothetical protein ACFL1L_05425 [Thermoplasmatota archaeon]